jgi:hypothetical protein
VIWTHEKVAQVVKLTIRKRRRLLRVGFPKNALERVMAKVPTVLPNENALADLLEAEITRIEREVVSRRAA